MTNIDPTASIHPTAYVHPTAIIGPNVHISEYAYIGPYCLIGMPAEWKGKEHIQKGVYIGPHARLTGHVTVDSGVDKVTDVHGYAYLMKHSHVGHDATLYEGVTISCGAKVGGHAIIGEHSNIGLNACIHQKVTVPPYCMIGMGAIVTKKTLMEPNCKYAGVPAKYIGKNIHAV